MMRWLSVALALVLFLLPLNSYAVIPVAVYVVETGVEVGAELLLANAQRSVFARIATSIAENPSAWAGAVNGAALAERAISYAYGPSSNPGKYEIPATAETPVPKPDPVTVTTPPPGWNGPAFFNGPVLDCYSSWTTTAFQVGPVGRSTMADLAAAYMALCPAASGYITGVVAADGRPYLNVAGRDSISGAGMYIPGYYVPVVSNCPPGSSLFHTGVCQGEEPDGKFRFNRGPSGFSPDLTDPDWNGKVPSGWLGQGQSIVLQGTVGGKPAEVTFYPTEAGTQVDVKVQSTNALGQPFVRHAFLESAGDGTIVNSSLQTQQNATMPSASGTTGSTPTFEVTFPDDYARDQSIADVATQLSDISGGIGDINNNMARMMEEAPPPEDPVTRTSQEIKDAFFNGTFTDLLGWRLPAHANSCPVWSVDLFGNSYAIDQHCVLLESHRDELGAIFMAVWVVLALAIVLSA